jgi:hypothetical protein
MMTFGGYVEIRKNKAEQGVGANFTSDIIAGDFINNVSTNETDTDKRRHATDLSSSLKLGVFIDSTKLI